MFLQQTSIRTNTADDTPEQQRDSSLKRFAQEPLDQSYGKIYPSIKAAPSKTTNHNIKISRTPLVASVQPSAKGSLRPLDSRALVVSD